MQSNHIINPAYALNLQRTATEMEDCTQDSLEKLAQRLAQLTGLIFKLQTDDYFKITLWANNEPLVGIARNGGRWRYTLALEERFQDARVNEIEIRNGVEKAIAEVPYDL